jgi:hypothetical protein
MNEMIRFRIKTILALSLLVVAVVSICRLDWVSIIAGAALLFGILVFAEDIWKHLPR